MKADPFRFHILTVDDELIALGLAGEITVNHLRDQQLLFETIVFPFLEQRLDGLVQ